MDAIIAPNTVPLSQVDPVPTGTPGYPTNGNPAANIPPTKFPAYHYAGLIVEVLTVIRNGGQVPSAADNTLLYKAIQALIGSAATWAPVLGSGSAVVPSTAGHIEAILDGGGGGGSNCQSATGPGTGSFSGPGGGAGGHLHATWPVTPGATVSFVVGSGGGEQTTGGSTTIAIAGTIVGTALGGGGASFTGVGVGPGAGGGTVSYGGGGLLLLAQTGAWGSDGQSGSQFLIGNGGGGFYGGGGRAGAHGGIAATGYGGGGGGAYDTSGTNVAYGGGAGASGLIQYRWLP